MVASNARSTAAVAPTTSRESTRKDSRASSLVAVTAVASCTRAAVELLDVARRAPRRPAGERAERLHELASREVPEERLDDVLRQHLADLGLERRPRLLVEVTGPRHGLHAQRHRRRRGRCGPLRRARAAPGEDRHGHGRRDDCAWHDVAGGPCHP